ncbi:hypothetical protein [Enterococcus faecium]|uniref:Uncharacterized protein n=1 Tax=Enterococcus faecium TaxID=1352 RepID=A0A242AZX3_ENTFC|nr:hypothetical protein [Enterococcus faecium]OTN86630.1 hypothetical protein A5810_003028 [Enterococcus faecium]
MSLEFLGEPIEKEPFVSHYMDLFIGVIKKTCDIDSFYPREQEYLEAERFKIGLLWDKFTDENRRPPDYRYLSDCLTNNVLAKQGLFLKREKNQMSVDHFCDCYIEQLRCRRLLTVERYGVEFGYVLQAERHRAASQYEKQNRLIEGYEELCICNNRYIQQRLYEQLMVDFFNLYRGYQCSEIQER